MKVLGFDTATRATTVALLDSERDEAVERRDDPPPGARPRHTTRLMALVVEVLEAAGADWAEVDRIAVGVGPGTFTGLRIGVATARALARAREIDLVGVSTLHSLARGAGAAAAGLSRRGDGGDRRPPRRGVRRRLGGAGRHAARRRAGARPPRARARTPSPQAMGSDGRAWLAVGDGAVEFRAALEHVGARIPEPDSELNRVSAIEHCRLALGLRPGPPEGIRPEYLRLPDAEITLRTARQ